MDSHEIKGTVKEIEGKVEKTFGKAHEKFNDAAREWEGRGEEISVENDSELLNWVREYPGTAVGAALVLGFLTASLLGSRR